VSPEWLTVREAAAEFDMDVDELNLLVHELNYARISTPLRSSLERRATLEVNGKVQVRYKREDFQEALAFAAAKLLGATGWRGPDGT
jgi:hypothetical protein